MTGFSDGVSERYRVYRYRWVVMGSFMFVNLVMQMLWIAYASVSDEAAGYYGVSTLKIGLLAMIFMIVFIPLSLPAAWLIDSRGFRVAVGAGAVLMSVGALARGLAGANYTEALLATVAIAAAQPLLLNAWTKVPANWFAPTERATGVALATLAMLVGIALGEAVTPELIKTMSVGSVQLLYGGVAALSAVTFLAFARERPATPPCPPEMQVRALMLDGLRHAVGMRSFRVYLGVWFMGMGIFNGVLTWVDEIVHPRGFSSSAAGAVGALALIGGVIGAATLAPWSDRRRKRVSFMVVGLTLAIPGLLGVTFASSAWLLYVSAFAFGFFLISVGPIGMQYAAEITRPTPEGTSQGLLQLAGQCSVAIVYLMTAMKTGSGSYTPSLLFTVALLVAGVLLVSRLHDPAPAPGEAVAVSRPERKRTFPTRRTRIGLVALGVLLIAAGGVARYAVVPAVAKLPSDTNRTNTYAGTAKVLLNQQALAPGSTEPLFLSNVPLAMSQMTRAVRTNGAAAVVEYRVTARAAGQTLPGYDVYYAIDRKTMEASSAISAQGLTAAHGLTVSFPIGTQRRDYLGWVQDTRTATPLHYAGTATSVAVPTASGVRQERFGLEAYVFTQVVPETPIEDPQELAALPASIPKSLAEGVLGLLDLPPAQRTQLDAALSRLGDTVPLSYTFSGTYKLWVAPRDGQVLDIQASEVRKVQLPARLIGTPVPIATVSDFSYTDTPETFAKVVHDAKSDAAALTLVGTTVPVTAAAVGAVALAAAVLLGRRRRTTAAAPGSGAPPPAPRRPSQPTPRLPGDAVLQRPRAARARRRAALGGAPRRRARSPD